MRPFRSPAALARCLALSLPLAACSSGDANPDAGSGPVGGAVAGASDQHCVGTSGLTAQVTDPAACHPTLDMSGPQPDGGTDDPGPDYGTTMFNSQGYDDDCKYRVGFYSTPVRKGQPVTFHVSALKAATNRPALGAAIRPEVFLSDTHPAPNSGTMTREESGDGVYTVGPIVFDASGRWTVRFHLYEDCTDALPESPHGHAAFYIDVP